MEKEPAQTRIRRVNMGEASHESLLIPPIAFLHSLLPSFPTVQQPHAHGFVPFRVGHGQDVRIDEFDVQIRLCFLALGFPGCFFVLRGGKGPKRTRDICGDQYHGSYSVFYDKKPSQTKEMHRSMLPWLCSYVYAYLPESVLYLPSPLPGASVRRCLGPLLQSWLFTPKLCLSYEMCTRDRIRVWS